MCMCVCEFQWPCDVSKRVTKVSHLERDWFGWIWIYIELAATKDLVPAVTYVLVNVQLQNADSEVCKMCINCVHGACPIMCIKAE